MTNTILLPPCTYQGGKHRVAVKIIDAINSREHLLQNKTDFYDLCCGSGAITLELINRGFPTHKIHMCDAGPWGTFWKSVQENTFDIKRFAELLDTLPNDKAKVQDYVKNLAQQDANVDTVYVFLILQAASFGGKQVWRQDSYWIHSSFRNYWQPTETSVRKSPVNPIQPQPKELLRRVTNIVTSCRGITCTNDDISTVQIPKNQTSIIYIDPPYPGTTSYGYDFDVMEQVARLLENSNTIYVSLNRPLGPDSIKLKLTGPKGGISGNKRQKHEEWLTRFKK